MYPCCFIFQFLSAPAVMQRWRSLPPSQNQNRSTCAQARVTCTVKPYKTKSDFKSTRLTGKATNQRSSHGSNKLICWYFIQSENARGAGSYDSGPSVFTSVNISSAAARGRETSESWDKRLSLRFVLRKDMTVDLS